MNAHEPHTPEATHDEGEVAQRRKGTASAQAKDRAHGEHHVPTAGFSWEPIETADKEAELVVVWDGAFLGYPIAARWWREPIRRMVRSGKRRGKCIVIGRHPGEWKPLEEELALASESCGGLKPTHWLKWAPPAPPTYSAWEQDQCMDSPNELPQPQSANA